MSRTGVALDNDGIVMPTCLLTRILILSMFLVSSG